MHLGSVRRLLRYPVKSMLGEALTTAKVTERGISGCRRLALIHTTTGKVVSAKHPRLWEGMLQFSAASVGTAARISCPDGTVISSVDSDVSERLSALLGQPVTLTSTPPRDPIIDRESPDDGVLRISHLPQGSFFDFAPLHLITTSTLDSVPAAADRYRPNLVIETPEHGFTENGWVGQRIAIGAQVLLQVLVSTPRCAVPTLSHGSLPRDKSALRALNERNRIVPLAALGPQPCAGVYAQVLRRGSISVGDDVILLPQ